MSRKQGSPRKARDVIGMAKKKQWPAVFQALGCRISVKYKVEVDNTTADLGSRTAAKLKVNNTSNDVCKATRDLFLRADDDFWTYAAAFRDGNDVDHEAVTTREDVLSLGLFPSLDIEFVPGTTLVERDAEKVVSQALTEEQDWDIITIILFFLCRCGIGSRQMEAALAKGLQHEDWRYVDAVAGNGLRMYYVQPDRLLCVLGLDSPSTAFNRMKRVSVLSRYFKDSEEKDEYTMPTIIMRALIFWCVKSPNGCQALQRWTAAFETILDFGCYTIEGLKLLRTHLHESTKDEPDVRSALADWALKSRELFFIKVFADLKMLDGMQADKALYIAYIRWAEYNTCLACLECGADVRKCIQGNTVLHIALSIPGFKLLPKHLPEPGEMNLKNSRGYTILHAAMGLWERDSSGPVVTNIQFLLLRGADMSVPYPNGLTVLQSIVDVRPDGKSNADRCRVPLLMAAVNSAARLGHASIDWTPSPGSEWSALHVLCHEGEYAGISRLCRLGADPLLHRRGFTLIDTTIFSLLTSVETKKLVLRALFKIPGLIEDHVECVSSREYEHCYAANFPLIFLIHMTLRAEGHFELIKMLNYRHAFLQKELDVGTAYGAILTLRSHGLHKVVDYLYKHFSVPVSDTDHPGVSGVESVEKDMSNLRVTGEDSNSDSDSEEGKEELQESSPPQTTDDSTPTSENPTLTTENPTPTTEDPIQAEIPNPTTENPTPTTEDPTQTTEDPTQTENPTPTTEDPAPTTENPTRTENPTPTTENPTPTTEDPTQTTEDPTQTTEDPTQTENTAQTTENPTPTTEL